MLALAPAARAVAAIALPALLTVVTIRHRSDYVGHLLAGFSGTIGALALLAWRRTILGWEVTAVVAAAIALGTLTELTIFRIAIFDNVDYALQSLGACVAGASLVGRRGSVPLAAALAAISLVGLVLGFWFAFT